MPKKNHFYDEIAHVLETVLSEKCQQRVGFCLLIFPFGEVPDAGGDYVSNAQRPDMIKVLRETANRLEQNETIGKVAGEA